jgi:acyl-CoA synthetase (AMP-forming)/AMP-acid ligase II
MTTASPESDGFESQLEANRCAIENNVGWLLWKTAQQRPDQLGIAFPQGRHPNGQRQYEMMSFRELDIDSDAIAAGLLASGILPGTRVAMLVPQSIEFVSLVFALFKAGMVQILIDPGMGRRNMIQCLSATEPEAMVAIPAAHVVRCLLRHRFRKVKHAVTVGRRLGWGGATLEELRRTPVEASAVQAVVPDEPAAIIFTTGSTGPPKGVLYSHRNFQNQAFEIQRFYGIEPGEIDLPGFPLFALFNSAMGVSTIIPDMDPTQPANIDPEKFLETAHDFQVTQAFGSPALWNTVGRYCEKHGTKIPTLRRALSAGAPVPPHVMKRVRSLMHPEGEMYTPYGATEALPVASNSATEVLNETQHASQQGAGTCVGKRFNGMAWKIIEIDDRPLSTLPETCPLPRGEIGELIVKGPVVTREYVTRTEANELHKIADPEGGFWHRMGDIGYLDENDRFWFCGRKSHRLETAQGRMLTVPCESIINTHPAVYRSALVGIGNQPRQLPVLVAEPWPEHWPKTKQRRDRLIDEIRELAGKHSLTKPIQHVLLKQQLPVDIRHNSKIFREKVVPWAAKQLGLKDV